MQLVRVLSVLLAAAPLTEAYSPASYLQKYYNSEVEEVVPYSRTYSTQDLAYELEDRRLEEASYSFSYSMDDETDAPTATPTDAPTATPAETESPTATPATSMPTFDPKSDFVELVIEAEFEMVMPASFVMPTAKADVDAFKVDIGKGIAHGAGVDEDMVEVTDVIFVASSSRRALFKQTLGEFIQRFLTAGKLDVKFTITREVPEDQVDDYGEQLVDHLEEVIDNGAMVTAIDEASDTVPAGSSISDFNAEVEEEGYKEKAKKFLADLTLEQVAMIAGGLLCFGIVGIAASCIRMRQYRKKAEEESLGKAGGEKLSLHGFDDGAQDNQFL
jgi:hypothetical protein